jgi:ABC-type phosphate transport system auxiliary subunit
MGSSVFAESHLEVEIESINERLGRVQKKVNGIKQDMLDYRFILGDMSGEELYLTINFTIYAVH